MTNDQLKRRSRILSALIAIVLATLLISLAFELWGAVGQPVDPHYLALRLMLPFYLWAIWSARRLIVAIGDGRRDDAVLMSTIRGIGIALFAGGICAVFVAPLIARQIRGGGPVAYYDVSAITLGVIGLALVMVAHLLGEAAAMRRELNEIV